MWVGNGSSEKQYPTKMLVGNKSSEKQFPTKQLVEKTLSELNLFPTTSDDNSSSESSILNATFQPLLEQNRQQHLVRNAH